MDYRKNLTKLIAENRMLKEALGEEIQKNLNIAVYFNTMYKLSMEEECSTVLKKILGYGKKLLHSPNLFLFIRRYREHLFTKVSLDENSGELRVEKVVKIPDNTVIHNLKYLHWGIENLSSDEHPFIQLFIKMTGAVLSHRVRELVIEKQNEKVKKHLMEAEKKHAALEVIIRNIEAPIFVADKDGEIIISNLKAEELLSNEKRNIFDFLEKNVNDTYRIDNRIPVLCIKERYYKLAMGFIDHKDGAPLNLILLEDITDFKKLDEIKTSFISGISHEIKTPLTSLISGLKLLEMGKLGKISEKQHRFISVIRKDSNYLLELLENLIYVGKNSAGLANNIEEDEFSPAEITDEIARIFTTSAREKDIRLEIDCMGDTVISDRLKIKQIIANLISNAIKYTGIGGIIWISVNSSAQRLIIQVKDTGIGISKSDIPKIFKKFSRLEDLAHTVNGAGIGLYIVKKNLELLRGNVTVESELEKGTSFTVEIPVGRKKWIS